MIGRPPKYTNAQEIQKMIDIYFDGCKGEILKDDTGMPIFDKQGKIIRINQKIPTVTGLALALGFNSRQAMLNYQGRKAFNDTITRAKSMIEEYAETRLFDRDGTKGAEFSLRCNFRWKDNQSEVEKALIADAEKIIVSVKKAAETQNDN